MKRQSFLKGALILMIAGFINRILGFLLRILLVRLVGDEGLGLFQMVYPFFVTLILLSTAGFPVAISKLIPEKLTNNDRGGAFYLLKITLLFVSIMATLMAILLYFSADLVSKRIFSDQRTYYPLVALIPALIVCPLGSSFKGFFQGFHNMLPTAISQTTEQITRISSTLVLINMVGYLGLKFQAASIAIGIFIGELSGFLILFFLFLTNFKPWQEIKKSSSKKYSFKKNIKAIGRLAIPITAGKIIQSLMLSGQAILIPRQLEISGVTMQEATSIYGQLSGMVEQIIYLPTVITIALTTSLIPNVSEAYANKNIKKIKNNYQDILRIVTYLGFPITVIFITRGTDICQLIFGYPEAGKILSSLALSSTFIYFLQVSSGMLNGLSKPNLAVRNMTIGSIIKLFLIFYLVQNPQFGIIGATIGITIGYIISAILNFFSIGHTIGYRFDIIHTLFKPLFCSSVILILNPYLNNLTQFLPVHHVKLNTLFILFSMVIIYLILMLIIKAITIEDLNRFRR